MHSLIFIAFYLLVTILVSLAETSQLDQEMFTFLYSNVQDSCTPPFSIICNMTNKNIVRETKQYFSKE